MNVDSRGSGIRVIDSEVFGSRASLRFLCVLWNDSSPRGGFGGVFIAGFLLPNGIEIEYQVYLEQSTWA